MDNPPKILGPEVLGIGYNNFDGYMSLINTDYLDGLAFHLYHGGDENQPDSFNNELLKLKTNTLIYLNTRQNFTVAMHLILHGLFTTVL